MWKKYAIDILSNGVSELNKERGNLMSVFSKIYAYPIKIIASYVFAPILVVRIALIVKDPMRRLIAVLGLLLSILGAYGAATFLGTIAGALFVGSHIGILSGFGFFFGTVISVWLSVVFSIVVFNSISWFFLHMSSQEVVEYLKRKGVE